MPLGLSPRRDFWFWPSHFSASRYIKPCRWIFARRRFQETVLFNRSLSLVCGLLLAATSMAQFVANRGGLARTWSGHGQIYIDSQVLAMCHVSTTISTLNGIQSNNFPVTLPNFARIDPYREVLGYVRLISATTTSAGAANMTGTVWLNFNNQIGFLMPTLLHEADHSRYGHHTCGAGADVDDLGPYGVDAYYSLQLYWNSQNMDPVQRAISASNATSIANYGFCGNLDARARIMAAYEHGVFPQAPASLRVTSSVGATTLNGVSPYAFAKGDDGNLWHRYWTGSSWAWGNLMKPARTNVAPAPVEIAQPVGSITVDGYRPYVFVTGSDGNLWNSWWTGRSWMWSNQGRPSGSVGIQMSVGATTVGGGRPYVFVAGTDGNLWHHWWDPYWSSWNWGSLGNPGTPITAPVGAITVEGWRPYVFVMGGDGNLWHAWWSGSQWSWGSLSRPDVGIARSVGAVTVNGGYPYVFAVGNDGDIWSQSWTGWNWGWGSLGKPPGIEVANTIGVVNVSFGPHLFVIGSDGNVWLLSWTGWNWLWSNMGRPGSAMLVSGAGVTETHGGNPYAFVTDSEGQLWLLNWSGYGWAWESHRYVAQ
jgi:hypothetical protein